MAENRLLKGKPKVINGGLRVFHEALIDQKTSSIQLNWRPPAGGDSKKLEKLENKCRILN